MLASLYLSAPRKKSQTLLSYRQGFKSKMERKTKSADEMEIVISHAQTSVPRVPTRWPGFQWT